MQRLNYDWLRNKSDKEIYEWLSHSINARTPMCIKCGKVVGWGDRKTLNVSVYDGHCQKSKKLCTLCNDCYSEILDYLGICDIELEDK